MKAPRSESPADSGFTLIELLVVIAIIAIVSSIAISQYALYKEKAVDGQMESTMQSGRHAMEAYFVEHDRYDTANEAVLGTNFGYRGAPSNVLKILDKQLLTFKLQVCAPGGTADALQYDSVTGVSVPVSPCA